MAEETIDDGWETTRRHRAWAMAAVVCCLAIAGALSFQDWLSWQWRTQRWREATPEQRRIMILDDVSAGTRQAVLDAERAREEAAVAAITTSIREAKAKEHEKEKDAPHECGWWSWRSVLFGIFLAIFVRWLLK